MKSCVELISIGALNPSEGGAMGALNPLEAGGPMGVGALNSLVDCTGNGALNSLDEGVVGDGLTGSGALNSGFDGGDVCSSSFLLLSDDLVGIFLIITLGCLNELSAGDVLNVGLLCRLILDGGCIFVCLKRLSMLRGDSYCSCVSNFSFFWGEASEIGFGASFLAAFLMFKGMSSSSSSLLLLLLLLSSSMILLGLLLDLGTITSSGSMSSYTLLGLIASEPKSIFDCLGGKEVEKKIKRDIWFLVFRFYCCLILNKRDLGTGQHSMHAFFESSFATHFSIGILCVGQPDTLARCG